MNVYFVLKKSDVPELWDVAEIFLDREAAKAFLEKRGLQKTQAWFGEAWVNEDAGEIWRIYERQIR